MGIGRDEIHKNCGSISCTLLVLLLLLLFSESVPVECLYVCLTVFVWCYPDLLQDVSGCFSKVWDIKDSSLRFSPVIVIKWIFSICWHQPPFLFNRLLFFLFFFPCFLFFIFSCGCAFYILFFFILIMPWVHFLEDEELRNGF